jgi:hypothetical protein
MAPPKQVLCIDPEVQGPIPGATKFSLKCCVWNGVRMIEELLQRKDSGFDLENRD